MSNPQTPLAISADEAVPPENCDGDYWYALIDQTAAADFSGLQSRGLEAMRQRGTGPKFIRISSRCIRYRRIDLKTWADGLLRQSTADAGPEDREAA